MEIMSREEVAKIWYEKLKEACDKIIERIVYKINDTINSRCHANFVLITIEIVYRDIITSKFTEMGYKVEYTNSPELGHIILRISW